MSNDLVKCIRCKNDKNIIHFMKDNKQLKTCEYCRDYVRNSIIKNRCPCGKAKHYCIIHGGASLCPCGKSKRYCKIHDGNALCACGKWKLRCKIHGNARKIVINCIIHNSKSNDKKFNIFDKNQFIDKQFVSNLLDLYKNCIYCNCELNFDKLNPKLASIERLDNTLGHIKRNCVIACFTCNVGRVGEKYN